MDNARSDRKLKFWRMPDKILLKSLNLRLRLWHLHAVKRFILYIACNNLMSMKITSENAYLRCRTGTKILKIFNFVSHCILLTFYKLREVHINNIQLLARKLKCLSLTFRTKFNFKVRICFEIYCLSCYALVINSLFK